jgi:hypothetical protein
VPHTAALPIELYPPFFVSYFFSSSIFTLYFAKRRNYVTKKKRSKAPGMKIIIE